MRSAISASSDCTLKVWDLELGLELRTLRGRTTCDVYAVAVSPDGQTAVSASRDNTLKMWNIDSGLELRTLNGHVDFVYDVVISTNGKYAASASADHTLKLWSLDTGKSISEFHSRYSGALCVAHFVDDLTIITGDALGQIAFPIVINIDSAVTITRFNRLML